MKFNIRIATLLMALAFVILAFAGCSAFSDDYVPTGADIELSGETLGEYKIIRSSTADDTIKNATASFLSDMKEVTGVALSVGDDYVADTADIPKTAKEIVIGSSNRPDGIAIEEVLSENEFAVAFKNRRIFLLGGSSESTLDALAYFRANFVDTDTGIIRINDKCEYISKYTYPLCGIAIDGIDIREYKIIIPENADLSTKYAALNLSDFILANAGFEMKVETDASEESVYEILIGNTNRAASQSSASLSMENMEYVFYKKEGKIICKGEGYMVGGGVGELISAIPVDGKAANVNIVNLPTEEEVKIFEFKEATNVILMIGDGMGFNTIEMSLPQIGSFIANDLPNKGNVYTGSLTTKEDSTKPTDSAASGTALSTATKTFNKYIGVDKDGNALLNIRELAHSKGANTGVITTDVITGATPCTFLAHNISRNDTSALKQQINKLVYEREVDWCAGSIGDDLRDETAAALRKLSAGDSSFFLMIEEAQIDKASTANNAEVCINMVERFNDDIAYVIQFVLCHPNTVLIVTADHETGGIVKGDDGVFRYTLTDHSTANVPIFALGKGTEALGGKEIDNTDIAKFMAKIFGENNFGDGSNT